MLTTVFDVALVADVLALMLAAAHLVARRRLVDRLATASLAVAVLALTLYLGGRWVAAGRAPFSNLFESLVLFAWTIPLVYLVLRLRLEVPAALLPATALLAALLLVYASSPFVSSEIQPLMPALKSNWLTFHVTACLLGYGAFAVSLLASIGFLVADRAAAGATAGERELFGAIMLGTVSFGFLFLTLGIVTGAVWANRAWGTYWSWDPKETWSLITWLIYAVFLHGRYIRGWRLRRLAWLPILGFASVLVTYLGVNYLMKGLHSYGWST